MVKVTTPDVLIERVLSKEYPNCCTKRNDTRMRKCVTIEYTLDIKRQLWRSTRVLQYAYSAILQRSKKGKAAKIPIRFIGLEKEQSRRSQSLYFIAAVAPEGGPSPLGLTRTRLSRSQQADDVESTSSSFRYPACLKICWVYSTFGLRLYRSWGRPFSWGSSYSSVQEASNRLYISEPGNFASAKIRSDRRKQADMTTKSSAGHVPL